MKNLNLNKLKKYLPFFLMIVALVCCNLAIADVGNNNRYSSSDGGDFGGGDFDIGVLIGWLINLFIQSPVLGLIVVVIIIIAYRIMKKKSNNTDAINQRVNQQASNDFVFDNSSTVAAQIQNIDPNFSSDKFIDIRLKKTNVVEKITIKHCSLHSFRQDGDKEVLTVFLNAMMRDYVIDDETKKVLESDPNRDWYMKYEMVFNRKAGVKTDPGKKGNTITNCPNCGAPTEITSSGQCAYCGSVITNGEHDWVLTDIHSRS